MKFKLLIVVLSLGVLTACNTINGMGRDIQRAGEKIEDVSKKK